MLALGNMKDQRARRLLLSLLEDEAVAGHAIMALRKVGTRDDAEQIGPFLTHPKSWVRQEARRTLKKLEQR